MKTFDQLLQEDIALYEGRHDDLIFQAPALYRLLTRLLDDPALPGRLRPLVLAAVAYFILPADVIPEDIEGPYGYIDDLYLCGLVAEETRRATGSDELLLTNWDGEAPLLPLLAELLGASDLLTSEQRERILRYVGFECLVHLPSRDITEDRRLVPTSDC